MYAVCPNPIRRLAKRTAAAATNSARDTDDYDAEEHEENPKPRPKHRLMAFQSREQPPDPITDAAEVLVYFRSLSRTAAATTTVMHTNSSHKQLSRLRQARHAQILNTALLSRTNTSRLAYMTPPLKSLSSHYLENHAFEFSFDGCVVNRFIFFAQL